MKSNLTDPLLTHTTIYCGVSNTREEKNQDKICRNFLC